MANVNRYKRAKNNPNAYIKAMFFFMMIFYSFELIKAQEYIPLTFNHMDSVTGLYKEYGVKSIPWNNGVLYLGNGRVNDRTQNYSFSLIQYSLDGNKIWEKAYQLPPFNSISAKAICPINENYLFVAGDILDNLNSDRFLCKLNLNGDTIFFRKYIAEGYSSLIDMEILSPDTLMLLSFWKEEHNSDYIKTVIDLVDTNGNIIKTTEDSLDLKFPKDIIRYNDIIYVGGNLATHPDSLSYAKVYISRYDLNLEYLGTTTPSLTERESFFCFSKTNQNLLFTSRILMQTQTQTHDLYRTNISRVDQQGALIDTNTFGPTDFAYYYAITKKIGNEFIVTYLREDISKIYFHDLQLNPLCHYQIDIPYVEPVYAALFNISVHSSNMISGTGSIGYTTESGMKSKQWNLMTDDIVAFLYENCNLVVLQENMQPRFEYKVVQSFSNKTITIESISNNNAGPTEIRIIDLNGRLVMSKKFTKRTSINIHSFSKGLYILQLINAGSFESHKFLVY